MDRKFFLAIFALFFFVLVLTGCQSTNETLMDNVSDIKEISISESTEFGKLADDFSATFRDSKELDALKKAFMNAKREKIKLESINYDLLITDDDGDQYLLQWYLAEEGEKSAFFYIGHEEKVYFTSEETTRELRKTIKLKENKGLFN